MTHKRTKDKKETSETQIRETEDGEGKVLPTTLSGNASKEVSPLAGGAQALMKGGASSQDITNGGGQKSIPVISSKPEVYGLRFPGAVAEAVDHAYYQGNALYSGGMYCRGPYSELERGSVGSNGNIIAGLGGMPSVGLSPGLRAEMPRSSSVVANHNLLAMSSLREVRALQLNQRDRRWPTGSYPVRVKEEADESYVVPTSAAAASAVTGDSGIPESREADHSGGDEDEEKIPSCPVRTKTDLGELYEELDDEKWLRKLNTAKAFLDDFPMLDTRRWLDWILDLQEVVKGAGLKDLRAVGSAALQFKVRPETRSAIRNQLDSSKPDIEMLLRAIRTVCVTDEQIVYAEKQIQELHQGNEEPLLEYLRRFEGWRTISEMRAPTERQRIFWKTKLIGGLNTYTGRLITAELYQMELEQVVEKLLELSCYDLWSGFTRYKRKPFMPPVTTTSQSFERKEREKAGQDFQVRRERK